MEAVALIPQIFMIWNKGRSESYMVLYLFYMAAYRGMCLREIFSGIYSGGTYVFLTSVCHRCIGLYILNWIYRYRVENHYDSIAATSGVIETIVGVFGFLCVLSQRLARLNETSVRNKSDDSIYFIPSLFDDGKDGNGKGSGGGDRGGCCKTDGEKGKYNNFHLPV